MAVDMFLKLKGIKGESYDKKHADEIEVYSWSWGLSQPGSFGTGGGGGTGKVNIHDLSFVKRTDKSSPDLMLHCCNGKHIEEGLLTVRKAGENPLEYLKIKMEDLIVSGISPSGSGSEVTMESISINFARVKVEYQEQDNKGKAKGSPMMFGWDSQKNQKI